MSITPRPLDDYSQRLYETIKQFEGFRSKVYSCTSGVPTVGVGYALLEKGTTKWQVRGNLANELSEAGVGVTDQDVTRLDSIATALNQNNISRARSLTQSANFSFTVSEAQARTLFDNTIAAYEAMVRLKLGPALYEDYKNSAEMVALVSLAYNSPKLIGQSLLEGLREGDRAEVWYQIRYASNGNKLQGLANRRFRESDMFGLYDDEGDPDVEEAERVIAMYEKYQPRIMAYESKYNRHGVSIIDVLATAKDVVNGNYVPQPPEPGGEPEDDDDELEPDEGLEVLTNSDDEVKKSVERFLAAGTVPPRYDPLILDLDGDGIETAKLTDGAYFDHNCDGFAEQTSWAAPDDGLLVMDRNGNGIIDSGRELFGDSTLLKSGQRALNGFQVLLELDDNRDGTIDNRDSVWQALRVWKDTDGDGYCLPDELHTLDRLSIKSLSLNYTERDATDPSGNMLLYSALIEQTDGSQRPYGAFILTQSPVLSVAGQWLDESAEVRSLPNLAGYGVVYDLHQAMMRDSGGILKDLVKQFSNEADPVGRTVLMEKILFKWTGSESISPSSRGAFMDARRLSVLEKLYGTGFVGVAGNDPNVNAAALINQSYSELFEFFYAELMIQTRLKGLYEKIRYTWDANMEFLHADLSAVTAALRSQLASSPEAGLANLAEFVRTIRGLQATSIVDMGAFRSAMAAANPEAGTIIDSGGNTIIFTIASNSTVTGGSGVDIVFAGPGNDIVYAGNGNDVLVGDAGDDALHGEAGADKLYGGPGKDNLFGEAGNDLLVGGPGDDYINGGPGDDTIEWGKGDGNDTVFQYPSIWGQGYNGNDTVQLGPGITPASISVIGEGRSHYGNLIIKLNETNETLTFSGWFQDQSQRVQNIRFADGTIRSADRLSAMAKFTITGTTGNDKLDEGFDGYGSTVYGLEGDDFIYGRNKDDVLDGGPGKDTLYGADGNDALTGAAGDDTLWGDGGDDRLAGGPGNDSLYGGPGNDILDGGPGNDYLNGGPGDDTYVWGRGYGNDSIYQYPSSFGPKYNGFDTISVNKVTPDMLEFYGEGRSNYGTLVMKVRDTGETLKIYGWFQDQAQRVARVLFCAGVGLTAAQLSERATIVANGTSGNDTMDEGFDNYPGLFNGLAGNDVIYGRNRDDQIDGGSGDDLLYGRDGADTLFGGPGADTLDGGAGDDLLAGGPGDDFLSGGSGNDVYQFNAGDGHDTVRDTNAGGTDRNRVQMGFEPLDIIFGKAGDHLEAAIHTTTDRLTVQNWNLGGVHQSVTFEAADHRCLGPDKVGLLIEAMASFTAGNGTDWNHAIDERRQDVQQILAQYWTPQQ